MVILTPSLHESEFQKAIKLKVETALGELGLNQYRVRWDPYENRGDLFVLNDAAREILVIEVKKTRQDVLSPRYWDQARKYVLNSQKWEPQAPKIFSITNAEELCVFCLRPDFTHIKYCLLENGKRTIGQFGPNGEADQVLNEFKESIKDVLAICLGRIPVIYDENWYPILEKFRVELDSLSTDLLNSLNGRLSDHNFRQTYNTWAQSLYPYYSEDEKKEVLTNQLAASMMFKALCYEVIRDLLRQVPLHQIKNVRLVPMNQSIRSADILNTLAHLYTDIIRIDYRNIFEAGTIPATLTLSQAGKASLLSFITALNAIPNARQEIGDPNFLIATLVNTLVTPIERHETGLTIEDAPIVKSLAHLCIRNPSDKVIDIAAGTCAILEGVYDRLKELKTISNEPANHGTILRQLSAIESNQFIGKIGALRLATKNLLEETDFDMEANDAFNITPSADYDVILCNPPYLRQAGMPLDYKERIRRRIEEEYRNQGIAGAFPYSGGQADKYFYFFEWGLLFVKPGGIIGFILSDKFLNSRNGQYLKKFMLERTNLKAIIKYSGKHFEGFDVTTCFVIAQRPQSNVAPDNTTRFIRLFENITPEKLYELMERAQNCNTSEARVIIETQATLDYLQKWSKKLLNLPQAYDHCYSETFMDNLRHIFADRVKRGRDNGCNAFFFAKSTGFSIGKKEPIDDFRQRRRDYQLRMEDLKGDIETDFLKLAMNSADLPAHYVLDHDDIGREVIVVVPTNTDPNQFPGLKEFIEFAEDVYVDSEGKERALLDGQITQIPNRQTVRNRHPWYSLYSSGEREDDYALIIPRMHRATFKILIPQDRVYFSTNFVGFGTMQQMNSDDVKFVAAFLMSSLGQLQFEVEGDWREGLLKVEAGQMYRLKAPDPRQVEDTSKRAIIEAFYNLPFGINGLEQPGHDNPRFELDKAVMALFYPGTECEARAVEVEEALFQTVQERDPRNTNR